MKSLFNANTHRKLSRHAGKNIELPEEDMGLLNFPTSLFHRLYPKPDGII